MVIAAADDDGLVTTFDASSNGTTAITKDGALAASTTLNSLITITHASDTDSTYTIVGTDIYGNAQTEDIAVTTTDITSGLKVFQTVTSITPSGNGPSNVIIGVAATVTNKSALVTITSVQAMNPTKLYCSWYRYGWRGFN